MPMASRSVGSDTKQVTRESYGRKIERHCLVVGQAGCGKSTIINMLINNGCSERDCEGPSTVRHGAAAGTEKFTFSIVPSKHWLLCDSIGFDDLENDYPQLLHELRGIYSSSLMGVSCIVFVVRAPRFSREDFMYLQVLNQVFGTLWSKQAILVITNHRPGFETGEAVWRPWCGNREDLVAIMAKFRSVIFTNNDWKDTSERCQTGMKCFLDALVHGIETADNYVAVRPVNFLHLLEIIQEQLKIRLHLDHRPLQRTFEQSVKLSQTDAIQPCYCGKCSKCGEDLFLQDLITTPCDHWFHRKCIGTAEGTTCPVPTCAELVPKLYDVMV